MMSKCRKKQCTNLFKIAFSGSRTMKYSLYLVIQENFTCLHNDKGIMSHSPLVYQFPALSVVNQETRVHVHLLLGLPITMSFCP